MLCKTIANWYTFVSMTSPEEHERPFYQSDQAIQTGYALGGIALGAFLLQHSGELYGVNANVVAVLESASHPVLGYVGAMIGEWRRPDVVGSTRRELTLAWVSIINFATESAQGLALDSNPINYLHPRNWAETSKDFLFAVGGGVLYLLQRRRHEHRRGLDK